MRYFLVLFAVLFLLCPHVDAGFNQIISCYNSAAGGGGGCSTTVQSTNYTDDGEYDLAHDADDQWGAIKFNADETTTVCAVDVFLHKSGTPTATLTACIYSDSTGTPGSQIGTCSDSVSESSINATETQVAFANISASITNTTDYWVVLKATGYSSDNFYSIERCNATGGEAEHIMRGNTTPTWVSYTASRAGKIIIYD